ncbi:DUF1800 domain-containing protein [Vibrio brasiliensis]|uniref:Lipoprotein n=1 Tax=Vibrio brasiliensis LMG 20546 TaxID=945543 RepID=E8LYA6_9VIBR|nr:DUF1800 domain-containing protein [Vibrio brasiliensis]EGA64357.1 hypothetical protein VIBR0546_13507 [Vibrio brasiliensis LMG 20546]
MKKSLHCFICISVLSSQGCFDTSSKQGQNNQAPVAQNYTHQDTLKYGQTVSVDPNSVGADSDGDNLKFSSLVAGEGISTTIDANGSATITILSPGTHKVAFTLTDGQSVSRTANLTFSVDGVDIQQAHRFFLQSTFGPTQEDIENFDQLRPLEWLEEQFELPVTLHSPLTPNWEHEERNDAWFKLSLYAPDQLRQRVAFVLSEMFVVSQYGVLAKRPAAAISYYDALVEGAFGNYRDLLETVSLHPAMGLYLTLVNSRKMNEATGSMPDENYAREVMQLFSIGLYELNLDGTLKRDSEGNTIPTYTQEDILNVARVFTGWRMGANYTVPMVAEPTYHDTGSKQALGHTFIAGQTPLEDMRQMLDILFEHSNTPAFFAKHMIQRLVTSNPSPAYVERVAKAFIDNGKGVRGDIKAVVKATLLDEEALGVSDVAQPIKLKEPIIAILNLYRANLTSSNDPAVNLTSLTDYPAVSGSKYAYNPAGQGPLRSPSVFNFFSPDYQIGAERKLSPEAELLTWSIYSTTYNYMRKYIKGTNGTGQPDLSYFSQHFDDPDKLVKAISELYFGNSIDPVLEAELRTTIQDGANTSSRDFYAERLAELVVSSEEFFIQD